MAQTIDNVTFTEAFVEADGFRVRCVEAGNGKPVLRIHGWGGLQLSRGDAALSQRFRVIAVELPGFGSSTNERFQSASDLAHTMVALTQSLGLGRYSLIGSSFGATVAVWQALEDAERIDALILLAPVAVVPEGWRPHLDVDAIAYAFEAPSTQPRPGASDPTQQERERSFIERLLPFTRDLELEQRLGEIGVATLVVFGTEDRFVPPEMGRVYRAIMPNCSYALMYGSGHAIEVERPEAAAELVGDFLEHHEVFVVSQGSSLINP